MGLPGSIDNLLGIEYLSDQMIPISHGDPQVSVSIIANNWLGTFLKRSS
jgi:hypothetical protein